MTPAEIQFKLDGRPYAYRGEWPDEVGAAMSEATKRLIKRDGFPAHIRFDELSPICAIIREAGGEVTLIKGIRPDGTIRATDFPDFMLY
jgi:hypothetical protein